MDGTLLRWTCGGWPSALSDYAPRKETRQGSSHLSFWERWEKASQQQAAPSYAVGPDFAAENTQFISDDLEDAALAQSAVNTPQSAVNTSSAWETFVAEVDARQGQRVPLLRTLSAGNQREYKAERRGAFSGRKTGQVMRQLNSASPVENQCVSVLCFS